MSVLLIIILALMAISAIASMPKGERVSGTMEAIGEFVMVAIYWLAIIVGFTLLALWGLWKLVFK